MASQGGLMEENAFNEDYYLRGKALGLSLYENYRWLGKPTIDMAARIAEYIGLTKAHRILDFGTARGFLVRALRHLGYSAWGVDISAWAIENADETVTKYVRHGRPDVTYDWIIAKDVLEHIPAIDSTIEDLMNRARTGIFAVVPLAASDGSPYVVPEYEKDYTHVQRLTIGSWVQKFMRPKWKCECAYLIPGIKQNYAHFQTGNGFITMRRT